VGVEDSNLVRPVSAEDVRRRIAAEEAAESAVRLFESEREARAGAELMAERIGRLQRITAALSGDLDSDSLAELICREITPDLGGGLVSCTLWMRSGSALRLVRPADAPETAQRFVEISLDAELPGPDAVRTSRPIWLTSREEAARLFPALSDSPMLGRRFAVLPLTVTEGVLGVLALGFAREGDFESHERSFFLAVTEQAAQAFERARLRLLEARTTRNNTFLVQASAALAESLDYSETLSKIVRLIVPNLSDLATIHLFDRAGTLNRVALAHRDPAVEAAIIAAGVDEQPAALLAEVVRGRTLLIEDAPTVLSGAGGRAGSAVDALAPLHIRSALLVPLGAADERLGVLSLAQVEGDRTFDPLLVSLAEEVAQRAAVAIENSRLHSELRAAQRAQSFLLGVATALAQASGYEETLERLGGVAVPTLGDLCLIDVLDDVGRLRRMVAHHADPTKQLRAAELRLFPPDPESHHPSLEVVRRGRSMWASEMSDAFLHDTCRDEHHFELTKSLGFTSFMAVPIGRGDAVLGSMTLVSAGSGRRFGSDDLSLAEELAEQVAAVIDKARRYEREHQTSHILQASLLPSRLPDITGLRLSVRYLPGTRDTEVGGDFYDVFQLPNRRTVLVIGDVEGHDQAAAAMMGHLRSAARALAGQADGPAALVRALQQSWDYLGFDRIATALFCQLDPTSGDLTIVSAGHPPPLLLSDHDAAFLPVRPSSPLGTEETTIEPWHGTLNAGDILLMYTDGVIEDRDTDLDAQMSKLSTLASSGSRDADELCDRVLAAMGLDRADDVALVAVAFDLRLSGA
jgi:serine/threonine-protein kinase RsbW